jgi:hypothetical protein
MSQKPWEQKRGSTSDGSSTRRRSIPNIKKLDRIARALGVTLADLVR